MRKQPKALPLFRAARAHLVLLVLVAAFVAPFLNLVFTAIKSPSEALAIPPTFWPQTRTLGNFTHVLQDPAIRAGFVSSVEIAIGSTLLSLLLATPASYAITFYKTKLGAWYLALALVVRMVPAVVIAVPLFSAYRDWHLIDTQLGLVLAHTVVSLPLTIWLLVAFAEGIPKEIEEAGLVDGCNRIQAFLHVILPMFRNGIAVSALFAFLASWNEFVFSLMLTTTNVRTVPVLIANFQTQFGLDWSSMTAVSVLYSIPVFVVTLLLQDRIVDSLSLGAVKG